MNIKIVGWVCVVLLALAIGFVLGRSGIETRLNSIADDTSDMLKQNSSENTQQSGVNNVGQSDVPAQGDSSSQSGLSSGQKKMLESFGLNPDEATLTPAMIACAEAKVGKARVAEIMAGATPSVLEGASLIACYK